MNQAAFSFATQAQSHLDERDLDAFPTTRYQGSKRKLLPFLARVLTRYKFTSALDLFSGTASVALLMRNMDVVTGANDYLRYNRLTASLLLEHDQAEIWAVSLHKLIDESLRVNNNSGTSVSSGFSGVYFKEDENAQIDHFCENIKSLEEVERKLLIYLMGQAMLMKRPYNLFHRANLHMRTSDVPRSFGNAKTWERSFSELMKKLGSKLLHAPLRGPRGRAFNCNTMYLNEIDFEPELVYIDPPYLNKKKIPVDYSNFYNFLEGLIDYRLFSTGDVRYPHRPIAHQESRWNTLSGGLKELRDISERWPLATLAISYRGDGRPTPSEIKLVLECEGYSVDEHQAVDYKYALSKSFDTTEDLIIASRK